MSPTASNSPRKTSVRRPYSRDGKMAIGVSVVAFFIAIGVVGWFGLSGIQGGGDDGVEATPRIIFAGGAPRLAVVEESGNAEDGAAVEGEEEDEYIIGSFGEPMDEFYADDDDGGWGDAAVQRMSDYMASSSGSDSARDRD